MGTKEAPQAFIALKNTEKDHLGPEIQKVITVLTEFNITPLVFACYYKFDGDAQEMMQLALGHVINSDLLFAFVNKKAIGVGIEMGVAFAHEIPIVIIRQSECPPSNSASGICSHEIVYEDLEDLERQMHAFCKNFPQE
ncbi:hypothetical protein GYA49_03035 [Candidatus Beckwithbacteria bacterium]|nr:hypothetical protein [Candidatus Beckwithbacteria bacterium]